MNIDFRNYTKIIGKTTILDGISISMTGGQVYGLWGINGSGKTMLMRAVAGLIRPSSGSISINGQTLGMDISFPKSIGILLEAPAFLDSYTGLDNLKILAQIKEEIGEAEIRKTLKQLGLNPDDKRKYRKYSLGMKQKLGIAAAIMEQPELILLDEPTNSLDEASVKLLYPLISSLRNNGSLIILASHDIEFLFEVSDKVYEIKVGRIGETIYEKENS